MNILYISYWNVADGLTESTVLPHLRVLSSFDQVDKIVFCSVERGGAVGRMHTPIQKVQHVPLVSAPQSHVLLEKLGDFTVFPRQLRALARQHAIDIVICRSAMAGSFGHHLYKKLGIAYCVESFEPHADYMVESGIWKPFDPRTLVQRWFEASQKRTAAYLMPVSSNYTQRLLADGLREARLILLPCTVPVTDFAYREADRVAVRQELNFAPSHIVGIYVGKYGGIYHDKAAFDLYKVAFDFFGSNFRLVILTAQPHGEVWQRIQDGALPAARVVVKTVLHHHVPRYLSAADFAFSTIKPAPSRKYCSPVKNGEYWANGLPILTEDGIGDDSYIIQHEGGGVLWQPGHSVEALSALRSMIATGRQQLATQIHQIAVRHRDASLVNAAYARLLASIKP